MRPNHRIIPRNASWRDRKKSGLLEKVGEKLTDNQQAILDCISQDNKISAVRIAEFISISSRKVEENIKKLRKFGLIEHVGPAKGGYWKVLKEIDR